MAKQLSQAVENRFSEMLGQDFHVAAEPISDAEGLLGSEFEAIKTAIPKRKNEFAAGRRAARRCLKTHGLENAEVPAARTRAPIWPKGFIGSITHDNGLAVAAVALQSNVDFVGIDLAEATPFPENLRDAVLRSDDEAALGGLEARAVFSAKEALFKALFPSVEQFVGFDATDVKPDIEAGTFLAHMTLSVGPYEKGLPFKGKIAIAEDRLLASVIIT